MQRSLAEIIGPWSEPMFESGLIVRMRALWSKPIDTLTNHELATCLRQYIAVDYLLPIAQRRLSEGFVDDSELYDAELAEAIASAAHWRSVDEEDRKIRGLPQRIPSNQPPAPPPILPPNAIQPGSAQL